MLRQFSLDLYLDLKEKYSMRESQCLDHFFLLTLSFCKEYGSCRAFDVLQVCPIECADVYVDEGKPESIFEC